MSRLVSSAVLVRRFRTDEQNLGPNRCSARASVLVLLPVPVNAGFPLEKEPFPEDVPAVADDDPVSLRDPRGLGRAETPRRG